jgi:hypothetical protein
MISYKIRFTFREFLCEDGCPASCCRPATVANLGCLWLQKNHIYTSGASGTNAAVIRGALRAERDDLLTVILPQSLKMQPPESQELLSRV